MTPRDVMSGLEGIIQVTTTLPEILTVHVNVAYVAHLFIQSGAFV
jgi:hypothetical protein